jgi:hypothetical protein
MACLEMPFWKCAFMPQLVMKAFKKMGGVGHASGCMVVDPNQEQVQVKLDWWRFSKLCCCAVESEEALIPNGGMPKALEMRLKTTTNLVGGKKGKRYVLILLVVLSSS